MFKIRVENGAIFSKITLFVFLACFFVNSDLLSTANPELQSKELDEEESNQKQVEDFRPTHEWQTIKHGQSIPKGLHVRINMESGSKEAKLLEANKESANSPSALLTVSNPVSSATPESSQTVTLSNSEIPSPKELKKLLRKIKDDSPEQQDTKQSFRSYEQLKKDFEELKLTMQTDAEVISQLIETYQATKDDESRADILVDLEYYIHQVDNAGDFAKTDSLTKLIIPALNSTHAGLRSAAALFLGSAAQSNPSFQIACMEIGIIPSLIRLISFDSDNTVQRRAMYAISGLIRNFPLAQKEFIHHGGLSAFAGVFESDAAELRNLQLKVVTLLHDLLLESSQLPVPNNITLNGNVTQANTTSSVEQMDEEKAIIKALLENRQAVEFSVAQQEDALLRQKIRQYREIRLEETLLEHGWCERIPQLLSRWPESRQARRDDLSSILSDRPMRMEHDVLEKVLNCMRSLASSCQKAFTPYIHLLQEYKEHYSELAVQEKTNDQELYHFYTEMFSLCSSLIANLTKTWRDEL